MATNPELEFRIAPEMEGGAYANLMNVWHTAYEFTLDFAVNLPPEPRDDDRPVVPCRITARVKIPPTVVFDVLRAINENMTTYERTFGEIQRPEPQQPGGENDEPADSP